ncbi:MAG: hypothetical protein Q7R41_11905 [Phycisphaerales bacterium]|nr:hypothetical protein [Phycisphaerales bacterium]
MRIALGRRLCFGHGKLPVLLFVASLANVAVSFGQSDDTARNPAEVEQDFPPLPSVRLSPIPDFADDASYIRSISAHVDEVAARAQQTDDPAGKAELLLAAANLILAQQLEPPSSLALLKLPAEESGGSATLLTDALDRADRLVADANESIRAIPARSEEEPGNPAPDEMTRLFRRAEALRAFADSQRAYLSSSDAAETASQRRRAASAIAPLLEDSDKPIASAARMWQAALRALEDDPAPALYILEPALMEPPPATLPYAFFSRLLRCRLIAARGGSAAALALLTQIEERANDWFTDAPRRADATRTCAFVRLQIVRDWYDRLSPATESDERAWCVAEAQRINERHFKSVVTMLRLAPAIPLPAPPPDAEPTKIDKDARPD